ncbi:hypothetical protein MUN88_16510 [Gracilibacillus caseinilyticus]|uniref:Lipoprotein n=1 Tax=Gracilibacillus caseinilyticus TaxID=2932256 RepID=A0ABY4ETH6_9BACI|nr:hypothetical protein [Gracilibacillus caseinilyticus]UOQ47640.1 hypothetical protein MUN88_16510 [Gracilibacillus caseinilyticus]
MKLQLLLLWKEQTCLNPHFIENMKKVATYNQFYSTDKERSGYVKKLFILLSVLLLITVISACQSNSNQESSFDGSQQGDWPSLSLDEMIERADLIAFVKVKDTKKQKKENQLNVQISTLEVIETIYGSVSGEIKLDQTNDFVKQRKEYLVFLEKDKNGYHYSLSPSSVIQEQDGKYISDKLGSKGAYTKAEVRELILK